MKPSTREVSEMGGSVEPYERNPDLKQRRPYDKGEYILFSTNIVTPKNNSFLGHQEVISYLIDEPNKDQALPKESKFLWIIDKSGFKFIREKTENKQSKRQYVCHTNITAGEKAIQGGEIWIAKSGIAYINNSSGRYGSKNRQDFLAAIEFIKRLNLFSEMVELKKINKI